MINDILDMSKVEAGKMRLSPAWIDPEDAVDAAVKLARAGARRSRSRTGLRSRMTICRRSTATTAPSSR